MISITENGNPIVGHQIDELESELNCKLPDSYRKFLLAHNGGRPYPDVVDIDTLPGSPTDVQVFFGITRKIKSSNISWNNTLLAERCPGVHVLPIACDSGGNLFCLQITNGVGAEVLYCDMNTSSYIFYTVAPNFDAFIEKLRA